MPGDSKDPTANLGSSAPQQNAAATTSGEFTQIFASGAAVHPAQAEPGLSGVAEDEFAKLFSLPPAPVAAPSAPFQEAATSEATLIFQALPPVSAPSPGAFTELAGGPQAEPRPGTASRAASPSGDFTQVFRPVAPPTVSAPAERPEATSTPGSAGEFTQFFSAVSARELVSTPQPQRSEAAAPNRPSAYTETANPVPAQHQAGGTSRQPEMPFLQPESGAIRQPARPSDSAPAQSAPSSSASAVTQVFYQEPTIAESTRGRVPAAPAPAPAPPAAAQGESFTQIFQQIAPPPQSGRVAGPPQVASPPQPPAPLPPAPAQDQWPAFGPPQPPKGTFTDVFAAQPQQSSMPATPWSAPSGPAASQGSGFTELFQAMPTSPARVDGSPFGGSAASSAGGAGWPSASQDASLNVAGGDFTRLMQSLTPGTQQSAQPSSDEAFFAPAQPIGRSQESEFTRIQQASARREAGAPAPPPAVAAPSLAAPKDNAAAKQAPAGKSKLLIVLLVAMNVLLLVALIVIGYIALKPK